MILLPVNEALPLHGVRVVELGTVVAGPFAASILADLGADVIKIEPPGGDVLRELGPMVGGVRLWWSVSSRDKRCMALDLKTAAGSANLEELLRGADVLVSNYRPHVLDRLGFGPDALTKINPSLVHLNISGFGQPGPYGDRPGFGKIAEGLSGVAQLTGRPEDQPLFCGFSHADTTTGLFGALGAVFALFGRDHCGGDGSTVDLPLYEPLLRMMETQFADLAETGEPPTRKGTNNPYGFGRSDAEGRIVCAIDNGGQWLAISLHDRSSQVSCARRLGLVDGETGAETLDAALLDWCSKRPGSEVRTLLERDGVAVGPVLDGLAAAENAYMLARGDVVVLADLQGRGLVAPGHIETGGEHHRTLFRSAPLDSPAAHDWLNPRVSPPPRSQPSPARDLFANLVIAEISDTPGAAFAASLLADLGATVIVIEGEQDGTPLRRLSPNLWPSLARNKRSFIVGSNQLDLLDDLLARVDVVLTDRAEPGWADDPVLRRLPARSRPLVGSVFATGADMPDLWPWSCDSALAGAASGLMAISGWEGGPPVLPEVPLCDYAAGALAALRIVARLWRNEHVRDVVVAEPLHRAYQRMIEWQFPAAAQQGFPALRNGNNFPLNMGLGQMFRARDGVYVTLSAVNDRAVKRLLDLVGEDLGTDPKFTTAEARTRHGPEINQSLSEWIGKHSAREIVDLAVANDVVCGPILTAAGIVADQHVKERGSLIDLPCSPSSIRVPAPIPRLTQWSPVTPRPGPVMDDGAEWVLTFLGRSGWPRSHI